MGEGVDFFAQITAHPDQAEFLDALKWDEHGRVTVVMQDARSDEVLGVAFADRTAMEHTFKTGLMHYYSRSRGKLWKKGEESGHIQKLIEMRVDCDGDALLARVQQVKANCHLGFRSCFSHRTQPGKKKGTFIVKKVGRKVFDPAKVYAKGKKQK